MGQLPQLYANNNGTFIKPLQSFNNLNKEEIERYIILNKCNYLTKLQKTNNSFNNNNANNNENSNENENEVEIWIKNRKFEEIYSHLVIDPMTSTSALSRAYYIPHYSVNNNKYRKYSIYKLKTE